MKEELKIDNFEPKVFYDVYKKTKGFFSHWKKDNSLSGTSLDYILSFFRGMEDPRFTDTRKRLEDIELRNGKLFYLFQSEVSEQPYNSSKESLPQYSYYKIVPRMTFINKI